jgi:hypothetical protein
MEHDPDIHPDTAEIIFQGLVVSQSWLYL